MTQEKPTMNDVFSQGYRARPEWQDTVWGTCAEVADTFQHWFTCWSMVTSFENARMDALDGECLHRGGWANGATGVIVRGHLLKRYVYHRLNLSQPPRFRGEKTVPSTQELEKIYTRSKKRKPPKAQYLEPWEATERGL